MEADKYVGIWDRSDEPRPLTEAERHATALVLFFVLDWLLMDAPCIG